MASHNGDDRLEPRNKWAKQIDHLGPPDTIISESTQELLDDLCNEDERSKHPTLPRFPIRATSSSRKRDRDESNASSSDAPLFSSDDLPSSSADNYFEKRRKRQHQRSWFEDEDSSNIARPSLSTIAQQSSKLGPCSPEPRIRGPFTRAFDSGVWMGSDETTEDVDCDPMDLNCEEMEEIEITEDEESDTISDGITFLARIPGKQRREELFIKAMQTVEDPGDFEGPVFPYWQKQPDDLEAFHNLQKAAQLKISECVDQGKEELDLSAMYLQQVRTPTLKPLRYYTKQVPQQGDNFHSLTPELGLYLSNNSLDSVPSEVYHLVNLKVLSLRSNNLTEILPAMSGLANLKELNIGCNQLRWLPWENLGLVDPSSPLHVEKCTVHPNPFFKPVPSIWNIKDWKETLRKEHKGHLASTRIAFLDTTGSSIREYAQAPSSASEHWEKSLNANDSIYPPQRQRTKTPSLMELAIRACYKTAQLSQLPFLLPPDCPTYLKQLLESTWELKESGGKRCSVCGSEYIIPRTEWLEWWWYCSPSNGPPGDRDLSTPAHKATPLPLLRRGCSWQCFEENPDAVIRGWSSSIGPGGREEELTIAGLRTQV